MKTLAWFLASSLALSCVGVRAQGEDAYALGLAAYEAHDFVAAQARWREAAAAGHALATSRLAELLARGQGSPPDPVGALALWLSAADAGDARAQADLGEAATDGHAMPADLAFAYARLRCAIDAAARHPGDAAEAEAGARAATELPWVGGQLTTQQGAQALAGAQACIASLGP